MYLAGHLETIIGSCFAYEKQTIESSTVIVMNLTKAGILEDTIRENGYGCLQETSPKTWCRQKCLN